MKKSVTPIKIPKITNNTTLQKDLEPEARSAPIFQVHNNNTTGLEVVRTNPAFFQSSSDDFNLARSNRYGSWLTK